MSLVSTFPPDHATVCTPAVIRCAAVSRVIAQYPPSPPVYFKAWNEVMGHDEAGGYGAITRLTAAHLITAGVQTVAWSGGKVDTKDIACYQNGQMLDSGNVDV